MGKRYGEVRVRDSGPERKEAPGAHNRKARLAAARESRKAAKVSAGLAAEREQLRAMWAAFGRHQANRKRPDFGQAAQREYELAEYGGPWPEHVPQDVVLDLSEQYAEQYAQLDDGAFTAEGARVGALLAGPGGAGLCDADRGGPTAEALDTLARAIALGSIVTGGIKVWGIHATWN